MITIDIQKLIEYLPFILVSLLMIQVIVILYKRAKLDAITRLWLHDTKKLKIYNKFIDYVQTDIKTGLHKSLRFGDIPKVKEESDYNDLSDSDQTLVLAVFSYLNEMEDLEAFEKEKPIWRSS